MIIIINGPLGIGKSETSWELLYLFDKAAMLDGDYLGAVQPFEIYDEQRIAHLYETFRLVAEMTEVRTIWKLHERNPFHARCPHEWGERRFASGEDSRLGFYLWADRMRPLRCSQDST